MVFWVVAQQSRKPQLLLRWTFYAKDISKKH